MRHAGFVQIFVQEPDGFIPGLSEEVDLGRYIGCAGKALAAAVVPDAVLKGFFKAALSRAGCGSQAGGALGL